MTEPLSELAERVAEALGSRPPHVVAIAGAVAVGKSTIAEGLSAGLTELRRRTDVVATDAFLYPNEVLAERGLSMRKGFPETFDVDAIVRFVHQVRSGVDRIEIPVYSHAIYDIVPGERTILEEPDLVILEGVVTLQSPIVDIVDVPIYVDAPEDDIREWFIGRFVKLTDEARDDASSFYRIFAGMSPEDVRRIAESTWDSINGVNLREHIAPSIGRAMFVVEKDQDHTIRAIRSI